MSLSPLVHPEIHGVHGKDPGVHEWCSIPGCLSRTQEAHHLWPRSALRNQPQNWVRIPFGGTVANKTGVCRRHHQMLTGGIGGHQGWIKLEHGDVFTYWEKAGPSDQWTPMGLLRPQPKVLGKEEGHSPVPAAKAHLHLDPGETCDSCGYTRPAKREALPKRATSSWGVVVPDDAEIGSEVLDDWVEQFAALLGLETEGGSRLLRYHVLAVVLAWAMQHRDVLISDIAESRAA